MAAFASARFDPGHACLYHRLCYLVAPGAAQLRYSESPWSKRGPDQRVDRGAGDPRLVASPPTRDHDRSLWWPPHLYGAVNPGAAGTADPEPGTDLRDAAARGVVAGVGRRKFR